MTKEELVDLLDSWENIAITIEEIGKNHQYFDVLMDISLNSEDHKSWRAAYLADKVHDDYPELLQPYIETLILKLKTLKNQSKKRHYLKLLSMNEVPREYYGFLVDYCINALTSSKEPPAVRVHAMQLLYNISIIEHDLQPELIHIIEHEIEYHATAGIISRGKKLIRKLKKLQN